MAPQPEKEKIPINSVAELLHEVTLLRETLTLEENEHTWEKIDKALKRFNAVVRGGGCGGKGENAEAIKECFVKEWRARDLVIKVTSCLMSERTKLSGTCLELLTSTTRLKSSFLPFIDLYVPSLVRLLLRPNKVYVTRTSQCLNNIIRNTELPHIVPHLKDGLGDKSNTCRIAVSEALFILLGGEKGMVGSVVSVNDLERKKGGAFVQDIEYMIKTGAIDREPAVRSWMKKSWPLYLEGFGDRAEEFARPLSPTVKRYLDIKLPPSTSLFKSQGPISVMSTSTSRSALAKSVGSGQLHSSLARSKSMKSSLRQTAKHNDPAMENHGRQERPISLHGPSLPLNTDPHPHKHSELHTAQPRPFTIHGDANFDTNAIFGRVLDGPNAFRPLPVGQTHPTTSRTWSDHQSNHPPRPLSALSSSHPSPTKNAIPPRPATSMARHASAEVHTTRPAPRQYRPEKHENHHSSLARSTTGPQRIFAVSTSTSSQPLAESRGPKRQESMKASGPFKPKVTRSQKVAASIPLPNSPPSKPSTLPAQPPHRVASALAILPKTPGRSGLVPAKTPAKPVAAPPKTPNRPPSRPASRTASRPPSRTEALSRSSSRAGTVSSKPRTSPTKIALNKSQQGPTFKPHGAKPQNKRVVSQPAPRTKPTMTGTRSVSSSNPAPGQTRAPSAMSSVSASTASSSAAPAPVPRKRTGGFAAPTASSQAKGLKPVERKKFMPTKSSSQLHDREKRGANVLVKKEKEVEAPKPASPIASVEPTPVEVPEVKPELEVLMTTKVSEEISNSNDVPSTAPLASEVQSENEMMATIELEQEAEEEKVIIKEVVKEVDDKPEPVLSEEEDAGDVTIKIESLPRPLPETVVVDGFVEYDVSISGGDFSFAAPNRESMVPIFNADMETFDTPIKTSNSQSRARSASKPRVVSGSSTTSEKENESITQSVTRSLRSRSIEFVV